MSRLMRSATLVGLVAVACGKGDDKKTPPEVKPAPGVTQDVKPDTPPRAADEYDADLITFKGPTGDVGATLTRPVTDGKHPGVLMIAGSGPMDRNWEHPLMPGNNGSGRLLARHLSANGFVVLRYDKQGTGKTPAAKAPTWKGLLDEADAGLEALLASDYVDPSRVFIAGHSEGGLHALRVAVRNTGKVTGVVLLSSLGRPMGETMMSQIRGQIAIAMGFRGEKLAEVMKPLRKALADYIAGKPVDPHKVSTIPQLQQFAASVFNPANGAFGQELYAFDPAVAIAKLKVPVLIVNGGNDIQINAELDGQPLYDAAKKAGVTVERHLSPTSDHVLKFESAPVDQQNPAVSQRGYNADGRTLDPDVSGAVVAWLKAHSEAK